ncbi:MAG: class I SAM-dependent methyltransferase [Flavobacteriaceae bacterium]|nr:class I SAM-dependent methyltransferase [Flavobacteriaceae bacterium]
MKAQQTHYIACRDHLVSQEMFDLVEEIPGQLLRTAHPPEDLSSYYPEQTYRSHQNAGKSLLDRIYQWAKVQNTKGKLNWVLAAAVSENPVHLDFGAGNGYFVQSVQAKGWKSYGVEPSVFGQTAAEQQGLKLYGSLSDLPEDKFDVITLWHVLEHVPNYLETLQKLVHRLKPGGQIIIAVPNYKSYDAHIYGTHWAAYDVPRHLWHFSAEYMQNLAAKYAMECLDHRHLWMDAFYISLVSEQYAQSKWTWLKGFMGGLHSHIYGRRTGQYSSMVYTWRLPDTK